KIILGVKAPEANISSWRFLPNTNKTSSTDPWPINDLAFYENLENDTHIEFKAIKIGDVDGSISKTLAGRSSGMALLQTKDQVFDAGDLVIVELSLAELNALQGLQIALGFNQAALKLNNIASKYEIGKDDYVITSDGLKIVKDYKKAINIAQGSPFITLEFSAQKGGNLASSLFVDDAAFDAVAQGGDEDIKLLSLDIISEKQPVMVVKQNAPNPFTDFTVASFTLENDMPVEITIYDQMGKMVYHDYKNYNKGTHILTIDDTQLKGLKGVFLLSVETAEVSEVRKMLRLK
ncbi:MAG TPA: T9SS type A sorting domain-containing protein, partial [Saprospiraceae bacterium]|nr:T9SS type A sorting domain-containing protein [Saprospiraceae bacterium]